MIFYALTSAGPRGRWWNPSPRGPAGVNVSEKHVWSLLLHKTFFSLKNVGEMDSKFLFTCTYSTLPANVLNMPLTSSLLCTLLMMMSVFVKAPDCLFVKPQSINSMWIALLIHGYLLVEIWLLMACDTAFYAIIMAYKVVSRLLTAIIGISTGKRTFWSNCSKVFERKKCFMQ